MKQICDQIEKVIDSHEDTELYKKEQKLFNKLLTVKIFEYMINDRDLGDLFNDIEKYVQVRNMKRIRDITNAFRVIRKSLF